jgi:hypothetical protein
MRRLIALAIGFTGFCVLLDAAELAARTWAGTCLALGCFALAGWVVSRG